MSEKNNVNPDYYKVAGRDRQGEDILQEVHKQQYAQAQKKDNPKGSPFPKEDESKDDKTAETVK
jgi:hypothetical protein